MLNQLLLIIHTFILIFKDGSCVENGQNETQQHAHVILRMIQEHEMWALLNSYISHKLSHAACRIRFVFRQMCVFSVSVRFSLLVRGGQWFDDDQYHSRIKIRCRDYKNFAFQNCFSFPIDLRTDVHIQYIYILLV